MKLVIQDKEVNYYYEFFYNVLKFYVQSFL